MAETRKIGVILNGVTGRMGTNQHLMRSIVPIIEQGGVRTADGTTVVPDPVLVGRNPDKLRNLVEMSGVQKWTTDLDAALSDEHNAVYFDAQSTDRRVESVTRAIEAGKHVYCEKPTATDLTGAMELYVRANKAGVRHGVVQDKLWLGGLVKLRRLIAEGFFGRILSVRGEFGYWVFTGEHVTPQRPSWNYKAEEGGSIILDMFCHWRYVLDDLFGPVRGLFCLAETHVDRRWDEDGKPYTPTADDAAYATFRIGEDVVAQFNSSWATRVRRDDLLTIQVDGTEGSAVAGLRDCRIQPLADTPRPVWNPDVPNEIDFLDTWTKLPDEPIDNAFKVQWELFLRHVAADEPFPWDLLAGAKGVQLAEKAFESAGGLTWVDVPELAPRT